MDETTQGSAGRESSRLVEDMKEKARDFIGTAKEKVAHGAEELGKKSLNEIGQDAKSYISNHTGTVIVASFVVGLLLGAILRGNSRER